MANENISYGQRLATIQTKVVEVLRTFESIQEELRPGTLGESQARLVSAVGATFRRFESSLVPLTPPAGMADGTSRYAMRSASSTKPTTFS